MQRKILILICNRDPVNLVEIKLTVCCFYFAKRCHGNAVTVLHFDSVKSRSMQNGIDPATLGLLNVWHQQLNLQN